MSKVYCFLNDTPTASGSLNRREVYFKPGAHGDYYDSSLRRTFSSKQAMRAYMARHKMRDAGERVNPNKHVQGREKSKPSPERAFARQYIEAHGGTEGLLRRIQRGEGVYV